MPRPPSAGTRDVAVAAGLAVGAQAELWLTDAVPAGATAGNAGTVVEALAGIGQIIDRINAAQTMISGVLTEQAAVTPRHRRCLTHRHRPGPMIDANVVLPGLPSTGMTYHHGTS
jgi:hypothetical protein